MRPTGHAVVLASGLAVLGAAASVAAGPILSIVDDPGKSGVIGAGNDLLDDIYGWGTHSRKGYFGASIELTKPALVTFTYLGSEAGYTNRFLIDDHYFVNHGFGASVAGISSFSLSLPEGRIDFEFEIKNKWDEVENCRHGKDCNPVKGKDPRFFTSFDDGWGRAKRGDSLVVFLDDDGRIDHDFDDMAVRIAATAIDCGPPPPPPPSVPEPGSLLLMGAGLAGLWARRRGARPIL